MNYPAPVNLTIEETPRLLLPEWMQEKTWPTDNWLTIRSQSGEVISYISHNGREAVEEELHTMLFSLGVTAPYFLVWLYKN